MKKEVLQAGLAKPQYEFTGFFTIIFNRSKVGETVEKTVKKIIELISQNPKITTKEIEKETGLSRRGVEYNIDKLKKESVLIRIGSRKDGYWKIKTVE